MLRCRLHRALYTKADVKYCWQNVTSLSSPPIRIALRSTKESSFVLRHVCARPVHTDPRKEEGEEGGGGGNISGKMPAKPF